MSDYDKPTRDVEPGETVRRAYSAHCVDIEIPRAEEDETHCTVHARAKENILPDRTDWHEGFRVDKRTHEIKLGKTPGDLPTHDLEIVPKAAGGE